MARKKAAPKKKAAAKRGRPRKKTTKKPDKLVAKRVNKPPSIDGYFNKFGQLKNARHELWCQAWVQTFDEAEAARAGNFKNPEEDRYKIRHNVMKRPECQRRIQQIVEQRAKHMVLSRDWVIQTMLEVFRESMKEVPITAGKDGHVVGHMPADLKTAHSTIKDLGVDLGMFQKSQPPERPVHFHFNYGVPPVEQKTQKNVTPPKATVKQVIQGQHKRLN